MNSVERQQRFLQKNEQALEQKVVKQSPTKKWLCYQKALRSGFDVCLESGVLIFYVADESERADVYAFLGVKPGEGIDFSYGIKGKGDHKNVISGSNYIPED